MAYTKQTWTNGDTDTPLSAPRLLHIEDGVAAADAAATAAASAAEGKAPIEHEHTWDEIKGKPAVIAAGADAAAARTAIGAGTSSLTLGTTNSTAARGNHTHDDYVTVTAHNALVARLEAVEAELTKPEG